MIHIPIQFLVTWLENGNTENRKVWGLLSHFSVLHLKSLGAPGLVWFLQPQFHPVIFLLALARVIFLQTKF